MSQLIFQWFLMGVIVVVLVEFFIVAYLLAKHWPTSDEFKNGKNPGDDDSDCCAEVCADIAGRDDKSEFKKDARSQLPIWEITPQGANHFYDTWKSKDIAGRDYKPKLKKDIQP